MRRVFAYILCFYGLAQWAGNGADVPVEPMGEYKTIDVRLIGDTIDSLARSKGEARVEIIKGITSKPENFAPPVFYYLSNVLFEEGRKDEGMFWFCAGQLRGRIDANICADKSAGKAINVLNQKFGSPINQYAFQNVPKLSNAVERVIVWEEETPCAYDRRWINLHGTAAFTGDTNAALSAPKEQWESIRKNTRDEFRSGFLEALAKFEKIKQGQQPQNRSSN